MFKLGLIASISSKSLKENAKKLSLTDMLMNYYNHFFFSPVQKICFWMIKNSSDTLQW